MKAVGAMLVAAVLGAGLAGCDQGERASSSTTATTTTTTTPSVSTPSVSSTAGTVVPTGNPSEPTPVLDHSGFGAIKLGMTKEELEATGLVGGVAGPAGETCELYPLQSGNGGVWVQNDGTGVASIIVKGDVQTAEGVRTGATKAEVRAAYPALEEGVSWDAAPVGEGVKYGFLNDPVTDILVFKSAMVCHN
ncbi:hypothetical protein ACQPZF_13740 [Actinosynnema sp. CS-041913]|uniref:hypothetical protein n=1 Tax=Actinosynnema sp. CS-041913 TaxID=3239917 RepID=UPI003D8CF0E0